MTSGRAPIAINQIILIPFPNLHTFRIQSRIATANI